MSGVWLMLVLAVIASMVVVWPWLRRRLPGEQARRAANVATYRTRIAEVDAEQQGGVVDGETAQALRDEAAARLLADEGDNSVAAAARGGGRYRVLGIVLAAIPVLIAVGWYAHSGSWRTAREIATGAPAAGTQQARTHQIDEMVARLRDELKNHPNNAENWALLGRSEMVLKQYSASARAYAQANRHSAGSNPNWLVAQGLAQGMVQKHNLQGKPAQLFDAALKVAPDDARALWYAGIAAVQQGDTARARTLWTTLAARPDMPADVRASIEKQIAQLGVGPASATSAPAQSLAGPATAPIVLNLEVRVSPALADNLPRNATLYVYAKSVGGSPMPLLVRRIQDPHFPLHVRLDDSNRPMSGRRLEGHSHLKIVARLSRTGTAQPASGDLQGVARFGVAQGADPVMLTIDQKLP